MKPKVAIIGANGQVGSEVTLLLLRMGLVDVVPVCRTRLGSTFLRSRGVECRHGVLSSPTAVKDLLSGCSTVVDCSLPKGYSADARLAIRSNLEQLICHSEARYCVYLSSVMAFGMGPRHREFKCYRLAHTIYGASKRFGERTAQKLARKSGKELYVLRLGEVHGELQGCTLSRSREMKEIRPTHVAVPSGASATVFTYTIAEALVSIALGCQRRGRYTLIGSPNLSFSELLDYYVERTGIPVPEVLEETADRPKALDVLRRFAFSRAERYRNEISSYFLFSLPELELRLRCERYRRLALAVASNRKKQYYRPFVGYVGRPMGRRLSGLNGNWRAVTMELKRFRDELKTDGVIS